MIYYVERVQECSFPASDESIASAIVKIFCKSIIGEQLFRQNPGDLKPGL